MPGLIFDTFPGEQQLRLPQGYYNNRRKDMQEKIAAVESLAGFILSTFQYQTLLVAISV